MDVVSIFNWKGVCDASDNVGSRLYNSVVVSPFRRHRDPVVVCGQLEESRLCVTVCNQLRLSRQRALCFVVGVKGVVTRGSGGGPAVDALGVDVGTGLVRPDECGHGIEQWYYTP